MEQSIQNTKRKLISDKAKETIVDVIAWAFVFLFIYTAFSKAGDQIGFARSLGRYRLIAPYADLIKWMVPAIEAIISILLIIPRTRKIGLWASLLIMIAFTVFLLYITYILDINFCQCGSVISSLNASQHLVFNAGFIGLAILALVLYHKQSIRKKSNHS